MPIASTKIERYPQASGAVHVVERHTDEAGAEYMRVWFADPKADIEAIAAQHAIEIEAELRDRIVAEKEAADDRALDHKLLAFAKDQPVEVLRSGVKLTDDEIAALQKREAVAVIAEAVTRG